MSQLEGEDEFGLEDNETSKLYKLVPILQHPVKYFIIPGDRDIDPTLQYQKITGLKDKLKEFIENDLPLIEIVKQLPKFSAYNIIMAYVIVLAGLHPERINYDLLDIVNNILSLNKLKKFNIGTDEEELGNLIDAAASWNAEFQNLMERDYLELENIKTKVGSELRKYTPDTYLTPIIWNKYSLSFRFKTYGRTGLEIFQNIKVSYDVPYVRFIQNWDNGDILTKIYKGKTPISTPNMERVIWSPNKIKNNTIYFTLWLNNENMENTNRKNFIKCIYDIESNIAYIKIDDENDKIENNTILETIERALSMEILNSGKTNISASFKIVADYDVIFDETTLFYSILNFDVFSFYLYLNESTNDLTVVQNPKIRYRSINTDNDEIKKNLKKKTTTADIRVTQSIVNDRSRIDIVAEGDGLSQGSNGLSQSQNNLKQSSNGLGQSSNVTTKSPTTEFYLDQNRKYLTINISKAFSTDIVRHIYHLMHKLLYIYQRAYRDQIVKYYLSLLPNLGPDLEPKVANDKKKSTKIVETITNMESMVMPIIYSEYNSRELSTYLHSYYNDVPANLGLVELATLMYQYDPVHFASLFNYNVVNPLLTEKMLNDLIRSKFTDIFPAILQKKKLQETLMKLYPAIFVTNLSRHNGLPIIVKPEEVEIWTARKMPGTNINRQVLPFPLHHPLFYFSANPYTEKPYPGWKHNTKLSNWVDYPYIPSTYKDNQIEIPRFGLDYSKKSLDYFNYINGIEVVSTGKTLNETLNLGVNRDGELPVSLGNLLNTLIDVQKLGLATNSTSKFMRYGVEYDTNSFLHCIAHIFNPDYKNSLNKLEIVHNMRRKLLTDIKLSTYRQELYDYTDRQIHESIADLDSYFDPSLYYRGVEEDYDVNVYIFTYNPKTKIMSMDIPRHKLMHIRNYRYKKYTILLYKFTGNISSTLPYPNYNIITFANLKVFSPEVGNIMYQYLQNNIQTYNWNFENQQLVQHTNIFNRLCLYDWLSPKIKMLAQIIDSYGKNRGYYLANGITIVSDIPNQPVNLGKIVTYRNANADVVLNFMAGVQPSNFDYTKDSVIGLWFNVAELKDAIYIPIEPVLLNSGKFKVDLQVASKNNPFKFNLIDEVSVLTKYQKQRDVILNIVAWLVAILRHEQKNLTILDELNILQPPVANGLVDYRMEKLPTILPTEILTYRAAIDYVKKIIPDLTYGDKIYCYNTKLYLSLQYYIKKLSNNLNITNMVITLNKDNDDDLANAYIFNTYSDFLNWYYINYNYNIYTSLQLKYSLNVNPYIYVDENSNSYIIQNVVNGDLSRAITVAYNWYVNKINPGFYSPEFTAPYPDNVIYGISLKSSMLPIEINLVNPHATNFLKILKYDTTFAAVLKM